MLRFRRKQDIGQNLCEAVDETAPIEDDNIIEPHEETEIDCGSKGTCSLPIGDEWADE
jgi:hypothetical protein